MTVEEYREINKQQENSKYRAQKTRCQYGHIHDSKKEADRCNVLHLMQKADLIRDLKIQIPYLLIAACQYDNMEDERAVEYKADFVYFDVKSKKTVIEDAKGVRTKEYIIKRKLMKMKFCDENTIFIES